jgi:hypothetical protein
MKIRTVTVELIRSGPRYNQLLSRTTPYLAVCGDSAATTITLPYEHWQFEHRLQELNYEVSVRGDQRRAQTMLDRTGREIAEMFSQIPGLAGSLTSQVEQPDMLVHLRIVFSASELAMLPFELTKVLTGSPSSAGWLALHGQFPVCITRHIRSVSTEGWKWPMKPRLLLISGPDAPFEQHRDALQEVMRPWMWSGAWKHDPLVWIDNASLADIRSTVAKAAEQGHPFTHVHVLAHGARFDDTDRYSPTGIDLADGVISGATLGNELTSKCDDRMHRPAVVTLASCDSARISDVRTPDASVAHDLHDKGIPFVVASQFQLSETGAKVFIEQFYGGQLWGQHPLESLYDARLRLSGLPADIHDWAALVVYEAFPSQLDEQLEEFRYWQTRRAQEHALDCLDDLADPLDDKGAPRADKYADVEYAGLVDRVERATARLPKQGAYALECAGLRAAAYKRLGQAAFMRAVDARTGEHLVDDLLATCTSKLNAARTEYWRATKEFLGPASETMRRKSNLHWLLGQVLSLDVVQGRELDREQWNAAHLAATVDADAGDESTRAWGEVSLSELALMRLPYAAPSERKAHADDAIGHAKRMVERVGLGSEQATATARQFNRYKQWWGNPAYAKAIAAIDPGRSDRWDGQHGLLETAAEVVRQLGGPPRRALRRRPGGGQKAPAPTPAARPAASPAPAMTMMARTAAARSQRSLFSIEMLPAENGDCLWIEYGDPERPFRVLVDCGASSTAMTVASRMKDLEPAKDFLFDLFVLTHIDADHINGVLPLFKNNVGANAFADIWFNGWRQVSPFLSVRQGEAFSRLVGDPARSLSWNRAVTKPGAKYPSPIVVPDNAVPGAIVLPGGMSLTLLSPGPQQLNRLGRDWQRALAEIEEKERRKMLGRREPPPEVTNFNTFDVAELAAQPEGKDPSVPNGSSIAFLAEYDGRRVLLTGDAHADVLTRSIATLQGQRGDAGRLKLDALKLSHHGSRNATTVELLESIDCENYLISTNGNIFYHPDRQAIARVIVHGGNRSRLFFNYRSPYNAFWGNDQLISRYAYEPIYPDEGTAGYRVPL